MAAPGEPEAWRLLAEREGADAATLKELGWAIAQELAAIPLRPAVVYPSHYRRAFLR